MPQLHWLLLGAERTEMILPELAYLPRFVAKEGGHGGNRRTLQMAELFSRLGVQTANPASFPQGKFTASDSFLFSSDPAFDSLYGFNQFVTSQLCVDDALAEVAAASDLRGVVMDDPIFFPRTMNVLAAKKIPVVSIIHNIEAFLPRSMNVTPQWDLLQNEVRILSSSRLCITIAREDAWMLQNFGIDCHYHPYYPAQSDAERLAKIRSTRKKSAPKFFLSLGTAYNPPTLLGMQRLANIWPTVAGSDTPLVLAGYGVERFFRQESFSRAVNVIGSVPQEKLDALLTDCLACVLHQDVGSGALTKIPELLCAGVPVVANRHALRSHATLEGVYEYQNFSELPQLLLQAMQRAALPPAPARHPSDALLRRVAQALHCRPTNSAQTAG